MPIFDLYCQGCKYDEEIILETDADIPSCPICGDIMKKKVSCTNFVLNGQGWASDGYSKKGNN